MNKDINLNHQKNNKSIYIIIICFIICITIIGSIGTYSYFNYQKEVLKQEKEDERIKQEKEDKELKQLNLNNCITNAKNNRTNLWNQNCTNQSNGSCTIKNGTGTIEWIEQRYQQDLNNCYQLYSD